MKRAAAFQLIAELVYDTVSPADCGAVDDQMVVVRGRDGILCIVPTPIGDRRAALARLKSSDCRGVPFIVRTVATVQEAGLLVERHRRPSAPAPDRRLAERLSAVLFAIVAPCRVRGAWPWARAA